MATCDSPSVKKRKQESKKKPGKCIIHFTGTKDETFTFISSLKEPDERFEAIKEIANLRQQQPLGSSSRMDDVCKSIPETLHEDHGYHRVCYNN